jgi:hypothetical protein
LRYLHETAAIEGIARSLGAANAAEDVVHPGGLLQPKDRQAVHPGVAQRRDDRGDRLVAGSRAEAKADEVHPLLDGALRDLPDRRGRRLVDDLEPGVPGAEGERLGARRVAPRISILASWRREEELEVTPEIVPERTHPATRAVFSVNQLDLKQGMGAVGGRTPATLTT